MFQLEKDFINKPYPYMVVHNILDYNFAKKCQDEILNIDEKEWDRYDNPFEGKYTLRNKNKLPNNCQQLFNFLTSKSFLNHLSKKCGETLYNDPTKNWWGIHKYKDGDHLDIHSDAGIHPVTGQKKHITLGIYLSKDWKDENGGHLEIWDGGSILSHKPVLYKCHQKILPKCNTLILFQNTVNAWHGNPLPVKCPENETRIFLTISYLSNKYDEGFENKKQKAYFIKRPNDPVDEEKDKLRLLRCDPIKYKQIYRISKK